MILLCIFYYFLDYSDYFSDLFRACFSLLSAPVHCYRVAIQTFDVTVIVINRVQGYSKKMQVK